MRALGSARTLDDALLVLSSSRAPANVVITEPADPLRWLAGVRGHRRFFWRDREDRVFAGIGVAAETDEVDPSGLVQDLEDGCVFGGHAFDVDDDRPRGPEWRGFLPARWVCPAIVLTATPGRPATLRSVAPLRSSSPLAPGRPSGSPQEPDAADWRRSIEVVLGAIEGGDASKVVLARRWSRPATNLDAFELLARLSTRAPGTFCFAFESERGSVFFGCSPERLFSRVGSRLETEAVAGTRPRTGAAEVDRAAAQALLGASKDGREHRHVVDAIESALTAVAGNVDVSPRAILPAGPVQHIVQRLRGDLRDGVEDRDVLRALHPTPAVGGVPLVPARRIVRRQEDFDRGWYAGPVGVVGRDATDLAVGIRSALYADGMIHTYAGAGIVAGSSPDEEWREIQAKVAPWLEALGPGAGAL